MDRHTEPNDIASVETDDNVHSVRGACGGVDIVACWVSGEEQPDKRFLLLLSDPEGVKRVGRRANLDFTPNFCPYEALEMIIEHVGNLALSRLQVFCKSFYGLDPGDESGRGGTDTVFRAGAGFLLATGKI